MLLIAVLAVNWFHSGFAHGHHGKKRQDDTNDNQFPVKTLVSYDALSAQALLGTACNLFTCA